jgi:hypothetical protein
MSRPDRSPSHPPPQARIQADVSPRWLHVILLAIALIGWMTFVLACVEGPAWSPDSSRILFGYYDSGAHRYNVALYNLAKHKTRIVFERLTTEDDKDDNLGLSTAWQNDGARVLILTTEGSSDSSKHCVLLSLPVTAKGVPRTYDVANAKDCWFRQMLLQQSDKIYLSGDEGLNWVDLATGESGSSDIKGGPGFLHERNGVVAYIRPASRPLAGAKEKDAQEDGLEFGQISLADSTLKPAFTIWQAQFSDIKIGDSISTAWEPAGTRIALLGIGENSDRILVFDENKGPIGAITPQFGAQPARLGNIIWSHDGQTLYAAAITAGSKEKTCDFSLAEIPVSGAPGRLTKVASFTCSDINDNDARGKLDMILPLALSPDGNWIAATPSNCGPESFAPADRALFLIDLRHQPHRITQVPFPASPKSSQPSAGSAS